MVTDKTQQIILAARPTGRAKLSDFTVREIPLPRPSDGELLLRGGFLSLDPYMRGMIEDRESYAKPVSVGDVMPGEAVCVVEVSRSRLGEITEELYYSLFETNVKGVLFTCRRRFLSYPGASIILNASIVASKGLPTNAVYSATKAAVRSFART